ncbi:MAG: glycosyltransferase family 2 protein [Acidobacteria bacterium]|nr:glycosyltransferase family 2 protein [Acidobacteriota bacterium]
MKNKNKKGISIALIVRNEERNIEECLKSVVWSDDIIVVDQSSEDKTVEIAKRFTDRVFVTEPKGICNPDRMFSIEKARNEWVLLLEADERVSPELAEEMLGLVNDPTRDEIGYYIPVKNHFLGKWIRGCGWYPSYILRLVKKGFVDFPPTVHSHGIPKGKCGYLKNALIHLSYSSLSQYLGKLDRYTTEMAKELYDQGVRVRWYNIPLFFFVKPLYFFFYKYLVKWGVGDGFYGFFISFSSGLTIFIAYAKVWEKQIKGDE